MNSRISGVCTALLLAASFVACSCGGGDTSTIGPTVIAVTPLNAATQVPTGSLITATFNTPLSPGSVNANTFYATAAPGSLASKASLASRLPRPKLPSSIPLPGAVTFSGRTATIQLNNLMPENTVVTVTITTGVKNLANQYLAQDYVWSFTTGNNDAPPTVVSTVPAASAIGVSPSASVSATFNKAMNAASLNTTTFTLKAPNGSAVPATIAYANDVATLSPTRPLTGTTAYTATITTGAEDVAGTFLAKAYTWTFTTASTDVAPTVVSTVPAPFATGVSISAKVSATFSEAMNAASITASSFTLTSSLGTVIPASVTYSNDVAVLDPATPLLGSTVYTVVVTTGVKDVAGTPMASNYTWTFMTASTDIAPTIVSTVPASSAVGISISTKVSATFSEAMNVASINTSNFTLTSSGGTVIPASVSYVNDVAVLDPATPLLGSTVYTATVSTGVKDVAGTPMANNYTWTFTTASTDIAPTVVSTVPSPFASGISISSKVSATFSEAMNAASINANNFTLTSSNGTVIPATVTYGNDVAVLDPTTPLVGSTVYSAVVSTGVTDVAGTHMAGNYTWSFTTASTDVAPTVVSTVPPPFGTGISISTKVSATFSEAMNAASINTNNFTLTSSSGTVVPATVTYANDVAVLDPSTALVGSTVYTAMVTTGVKDIAGTPMASNYSWSFTTASTDVAPTVLSTVPAPVAVGISVNSAVSATFSEAMNAASINVNDFTLTSSGGTVITATVTYANDVAVLSPTTPLAGSTVYTAALSTAVKDVAGTPLANTYSWTFMTASTDVAPTVVSTVPVASAAGVLATTTVSATFSKAMNASSINTTTFSLATSNGTTVPATVTYANDVATLTPNSALIGGTTYTATVSTGAKDVAGTPLANAYQWKFTTDTAPTVLSNIPLAGATGVLLTTTVSATFSEAMNAASINTTTFTVAGPNGVAVSATVTYANDVTTLTPTSPLSGGVTYTATVSTGAKDVAGTALANAYQWKFTTDIAPTVVSTFPVNNQTQVGVTNDVTATFSEALSAATVNGATFTLTGPGGSSVTAKVTYANKVATLAPTANLAGTTVYTAKLTTGVKDVAGTPLANTYTWTFTTGQAEVNLGTSGTFGVLAGSTVTNSGPTNITGDLGVSPGTAITGFPPGTFTGSEHAGDPVAAKAKADLLAAYTDASGRLGGNALPGDISGLTITPGLYTNSSSVMVQVGANVTFDAKGDANAVFILQMGSTLTTGVGSTMTLAGGAQAKNIFWSVGSSATLGVNSSIVGNVLAQASITANTGTSVLGRLLTNVAAVSLASNPITVP